MLAYEFLYTGIGQSVAAYAPNEVFATLVNPLLLGTLISFCGVLVPYAQMQPFGGTTCAAYLEAYLGSGSGSVPGRTAHLINPNDTSSCHVCAYTTAQDYLRTLNLNVYYYGWRDAGIMLLMVLSSYGMVYALMKLRTKTSKTAG
ncbi:hypothetical protein E4U41_002667 [Claviceps citrina]|nr:hypothetical protein E4U41_002667 [Claviceps citrina]